MTFSFHTFSGIQTLGVITMAHADDRADALSLQASDEDLSLEEGPRAQEEEGAQGSQTVVLMTINHLHQR